MDLTKRNKRQPMRHKTMIKTLRLTKFFTVRDLTMFCTSQIGSKLARKVSMKSLKMPCTIYTELLKTKVNNIS